MGHIQGANRHDVILLPERLDDYSAEDTPVRFLDAFVDELDLEQAASNGPCRLLLGDLAMPLAIC